MNSSYGWFGGGNNNGGTPSVVERIDYSSDTSTASPRGSLTSSTYQVGAQVIIPLDTLVVVVLDHIQQYNVSIILTTP